MGNNHNYSKDGGLRFYTKYNSQKYQLACHKHYQKDSFDEDSVLLIVDSNPKLKGLIFNCDDFGNEIWLYYKDDAFDMKNWMLYVHKQENNNYYTSVFHRTKCSKFLLERFGEDSDTFLIK